MAIVNFESVADAANALVAAGERASVRKVIARLGGGSPNSVLKHLSEWKTGRPVVRASDTNLDAKITIAIVEQMQRVASDAAAAAEERAAATEEDLSALSESQCELEQQVATLAAERDASREQSVTLSVQLHELTAAAERERQQAMEQLATLRADVATAHVHNEQTVAALAKSEVRLEALPELQVEVARLRGLLDTESKSRIVAEQSAAVLAVRLDTAEKRAVEAGTRADAAHAQLVSFFETQQAAQPVVQPPAPVARKKSSKPEQLALGDAADAS